MSVLNMKLSDVANAEDKLKLKTLIEDKIAAGPKKTRILVRNHDTGEILADTSNKIIVSGSYLNAAKMFGLDFAGETIFPTYNSAMQLDESPIAEEESEDPLVCLFCVDDSGCGSTQKDVYKNTNKDWIKPAATYDGTGYTPEDPLTGDTLKIMPFRYVDASADLNDDLRKYYFGRKTFSNNKIGYFFKKFDTEPQIHLQLADGTQINTNAFEVDTEQVVECFVETRLRITRLDFRDYFDQLEIWDKARVSSVSLLFGRYKKDVNGQVWYEDVRPYTKLNFPFQYLVDLTVAIDFDYQIYF